MPQVFAHAFECIFAVHLSPIQLSSSSLAVSSEAVRIFIMCLFETSRELWPMPEGEMFCTVSLQVGTCKQQLTHL